MSGVQFFREYRGSGEIAHPAAEPASRSELLRINTADVAVNNLVGLHTPAAQSFWQSNLGSSVVDALPLSR